MPSAVKIFLQHKDTSLFFQRLDIWTASYNDAFDFRHARKAIDFAGLYAIENVRILVVAPTSAGHMRMLPFEIPGQERQLQAEPAPAA